MYINSLGMGGITSHVQKNNSAGTANINSGNYDTAMQKAMEKRSAAIASAADGDMILTQPSYYQKSTKQQSVSGKEKSAMSMREYRQWFRGEVAGIQAEAYSRSPYLSDTLVIKEEAFEKMKNDPEWEKEVLGRIREHCYGNEITGTKAIGYQVIGALPETCHEEEIPVNASGLSSLSSSLYASSPYAGFYAANPLLTQSGYWNNMLTGQTGLSNYLTQGLLGSQNSLGALASTVYGNVMNGGLGSSLLGNFLI